MARTDRPDSGRAQRDGFMRRWGIPVAIGIAVAALIAGVLWMQQDPAAPEGATSGSSEGTAGTEHPGSVEHPSSVAAPDLSAQEGRDQGDLLAEGPVEAPVVLVMFTDYQCPYCAKWSDETLLELREYVERGELRIEYRDVNVYGEDSERAARASLAAAKQGAHAEYHAALFEGGEIRSSEELSEEALIALAGELGLDTEQFAADLNSEEVRATIEENAQQGIEIGAFSTPAFIIGGTPTVGAQPTEVFTEMVDQALAESEG
ncbi:MAG: thioredoxin domain-containing protein [Brachybacterium sp.]|nr:thioredoxin domain-containing protein [Brachybacterium sp.]